MDKFTNSRSLFTTILKLYKHSLEKSDIEKIWSVIRRLDPIVLESALQMYLSTSESEWFSWDSLKNAIKKSMRTKYPSGYEQFGVVSKQLIRCGLNGRQSIDLITDKVIDQIGGWAYLFNSTNLGMDRANFIKAYDQLVEDKITEEMMSLWVM